MEKVNKKDKWKKRIHILGFVVLGIIIVGAIIFPNNEPIGVLEPGYPKEIEREPYSFGARNMFEETQLKEFLGIYPPGDDMDTWLSRKDSAGLQQWRDYWFDIFSPYGRVDLLTFIDHKFVECKIQLNEK